MRISLEKKLLKIKMTYYISYIYLKFLETRQFIQEQKAATKVKNLALGTQKQAQFRLRMHI